jgi:hypothetical protein
MDARIFADEALRGMLSDAHTGAILRSRRGQAEPKPRGNARDCLTSFVTWISKGSSCDPYSTVGWQLELIGLHRHPDRAQKRYEDLGRLRLLFGCFVVPSVCVFLSVLLFCSSVRGAVGLGHDEIECL